MARLRVGEMAETPRRQGSASAKTPAGTGRDTGDRGANNGAVTLQEWRTGGSEQAAGWRGSSC
jgi:hypothetical protein